MNYQELKQQQSDRLTEIMKNGFWAFNNEQFFEGLNKLGLTKEDTNKLV